MEAVYPDEVQRSHAHPQPRSEEETRRVIIGAATQEFLEHGFSASMDRVARRAGVSKKTIYRVVARKAALLGALLAERRESLWLPADASRIEPLAPREALEYMLGKVARQALSREFIGICRVMSAESIHFPGLAPTFYNEEPKHSIDLIAALLERFRSRGLLNLQDTSAGAAMLLHMITGPSFTTTILGIEDTPDEDTINQRVRDGVRIFLQGCATADGTAE